LSRKACHPEKIEFFGFVLPNCRSFSRTPGPPLFSSMGSIEDQTGFPLAITAFTFFLSRRCI